MLRDTRYSWRIDLSSAAVASNVFVSVTDLTRPITSLYNRSCSFRKISPVGITVNNSVWFSFSLLNLQYCQPFYTLIVTVIYYDTMACYYRRCRCNLRYAYVHLCGNLQQPKVTKMQLNMSFLSSVGASSNLEIHMCFKCK